MRRYEARPHRRPDPRPARPPDAGRPRRGRAPRLRRGARPRRFGPVPRGRRAHGVRPALGGETAAGRRDGPARADALAGPARARGRQPLRRGVPSRRRAAHPRHLRVHRGRPAQPGRPPVRPGRAGGLDRPGPPGAQAGPQLLGQARRDAGHRPAPRLVDARLPRSPPPAATRHRRHGRGPRGREDRAHGRRRLRYSPVRRLAAGAHPGRRPDRGRIARRRRKVSSPRRSAPTRRWSPGAGATARH